MSKDKVQIVLCSIVLLAIVFAAPCPASWLIYHKSEFKGKVTDAETKQPIEGAVVVAKYFKHPIITGPAGGSASIIHIKMHNFLTGNSRPSGREGS
jgi:hypothetical protein